MTYAVTPRPHIVRVPRHLILLRIFQLLLATLILALTAYGIHVLSASGIILTLVTGRPTPPSFHAEDFVTTTHGNSTNSTNSISVLDATISTVPGGAGGNVSTHGESTPIDPSRLPKLSPNSIEVAVVTQALSPQILDSEAPVTGPPALNPQVQKRDSRIKPGEYFPDVPMINFRDLDLAKYCRHPLEDVERGAPETVPHQLNDWNDRFRTGEYFAVAGQVHRLVKRLAPGAFTGDFFTGGHDKDRSFKEWMKVFWQEVEEEVIGHQNGKSYREIRRERMGRGLNPWGSPLENKNRMPPQWLMMGHAQTALLSLLHLTLTLLTTHCPTFSKFYDYPLLLILEFFLLVLWLISFCILAAQVTVARAIGEFPKFRYPAGHGQVGSVGLAPMIGWIGYGTACGEDGYCYTYASWDKRKDFLALMAGAAALSAVMFLTYLISFSIFMASVLKHRREGGMKKPLDPAKSHPGAFSFDETCSYTNNHRSPSEGGVTDEEAMKHGMRSKVEKIREKEAKRVAREDRKALRNMRKGGVPKDWKNKPTILTSSGGIFDGPVTPGEEGRGRSNEQAPELERPKTHSRFSLHLFERKQMEQAAQAGTDRERERERERERGRRSEMEPAQTAEYMRGG